MKNTVGCKSNFTLFSRLFFRFTFGGASFAPFVFRSGTTGAPTGAAGGFAFFGVAVILRVRIAVRGRSPNAFRLGRPSRGKRRAFVTQRVYIFRVQ